MVMNSTGEGEPEAEKYQDLPGKWGPHEGALRRDPQPAAPPSAAPPHLLHLSPAEGTSLGSRKPPEMPEENREARLPWAGDVLCHLHCSSPLTDVAWMGKVTLFKTFFRTQK